MEYNPVWIDRTFKSRQLTESLLAPEREAGLLTTHDYDAALSFFPDFHRRYNSLGMVLGGCLMYSIRKPSWSTPKTTALVLTSAVLGRAVGAVSSVREHYQFARSIENPAGFAQAMQNIQRKLGQPVMRPIGRPQDHTSADDHSQERDFQLPPPRASLEQPPMTKPTTSTGTWDRIRAANVRTAGNSSWDTLRQKHESARIQNRVPDTTVDDVNGEPVGQAKIEIMSRTEEQAKFDALLDRERNMK